MGAYLPSRHFANVPAILFNFSAAPRFRPTGGTPPCPLGLWTPPFPFSSRSNQAGPQPLLYLLHFHGGSPGYPPIPPRIFLLRTEAHPLNPPTRDRRPCPSIRTTSDRKPTSIVSTSSSLHSCARSSSIFSSPEDIYDGIAQTIYLPIQLIAGITLFDIRRKGYLLTLLIFLGGLLIVGRLLDSFTPLNLREYLVFAYVVFFGWVTLELFRQIYTAPLVDRESVLAALCGLLLIGYCGFFVFVAVEFHQPGSFSGSRPAGRVSVICSISAT